MNTGDMQSDELGAFRQPEQHSKACRVDGHRQRGLLRELEGFRFSLLPPLSLGVGRCVGL